MKLGHIYGASWTKPCCFISLFSPASHDAAPIALLRFTLAFHAHCVLRVAASVSAESACIDQPGL